MPYRKSTRRTDSTAAPATPTDQMTSSVTDFVGNPPAEEVSAPEPAPVTVEQSQDSFTPRPRRHFGPDRSPDTSYSQVGDEPREVPSGTSPRYPRNLGNGNGHYSQVESVPTEVVTGFLDLQPEGHGFLRPKFIPSNRDIYISQSQIRRFMLRGGDKVEGVARPPKDSERYYGLLKVEKVNEKSPEEAARRPWFDDLTPIYPKQQLTLATGKSPLSTRIIDLVAPIGMGQRGMIVSPPKAGKTTIMKEIATGITKNFPDIHLMAALIGERPEEVTDLTMSVRGRSHRQ